MVTALTLASSCVLPMEPGYREIQIDTTLTEAQQDAVITAAAIWNQATTSPAFSWHHGRAKRIATHVIATSQVGPSRKPLETICNQRRCMVYMGLASDEIIPIMHQLGITLGLPFDDIPHSIMNPNLSMTADILPEHIRKIRQLVEDQ